MTVISNLLCEYRPTPLGIDVTAPRLCWQIQTDRHGARQTAYRILAAREPDLLTNSTADLWDSGRVESDQSAHVVYKGQRLRSRQRVYWMVTVWDETGAASHSDPTWFEMGLLTRKDWKAKWIGAGLRGGPHSTIPAPYVRKSFVLPAEAQSARLYVTAYGLYECSINGHLVSDDVFTPGWTDYHQRVQYMVYDVLSLLCDGENVLGAILGDGWAVGHVGWESRQQYYDRPLLLAQLEIRTADGRMITVKTDRTWKYQFGPLLENDILMGEAYDARLEMPGWDMPGFHDARWSRVDTFTVPETALVATNGPTVRRVTELTPIDEPVDKGSSDSPRFIFDLGQNMAGRVRFKGSAPARTTIRLRFAEMLNPDGSLYTTNLRTARATDYYTFKGDGQEVWEPKFTFHGFRYVELTGYHGNVSRDTITGVALHSVLAQTGQFECSDPFLNQLQHNIVWTQKSNFLDVPTDCPQRDERLGWAGDIQTYAQTAAFNMDIAGFMTKWIQDLADAQDEQGRIPPLAPEAQTSSMRDGGPAWADAVIICPWTIYLRYGDRRILQKHYATMDRFMQFLIRTSPGYVRCAPDYEGWLGFGDWLSINADTPRDLIGTAFLAYDANLMAQIADVLGMPREAAKYRTLFADAKAAFGGRFLKDDLVPPSFTPPAGWQQEELEGSLSIGRSNRAAGGPIRSEVFKTGLFTPTQTAYVLALYFDLLPEALRRLAVDELVADIEGHDLHLSTGFVGAAYLLQVLSNGGRLDIAYTLLHQKSWPSWLYPVIQGATTIWERWDGWTEEKGFQTPGMNSFNHYAFGAVGAWIYSRIAGIDCDPIQPGFKHIILRPQPAAGMAFARGRLKTLYGEFVSEWEVKKDKFEWTVVVPPNTTATIDFPPHGQGRVLVNGESVSGTNHFVEAGRHQIVIT